MSRKGNGTTKAELILHPVRLRILLALSGEQRRTPQQIAALMKDEPLTSIYRHLNKLLDHGLVEVVETRQVRGTVEKTYRLNTEAADLTRAEISEVKREESAQYMSNYLAILMRAIQRYIDYADPFDATQLTYRYEIMHLTNAEFMQFLEDRDQLVQKYRSIPPTDDRIPRLVSIISLPFQEETLSLPADDVTPQENAE